MSIHQGYITSVRAKKDGETQPIEKELVSLRDFKPEVRIGVQMTGAGPALMTNTTEATYNVAPKGIAGWLNDYYNVFGCSPQIKMTIDLYSPAGVLASKYSSDEGMFLDLTAMTTDETISFRGVVGEFNMIMESTLKYDEHKYIQTKVNAVISLTQRTDTVPPKCLADVAAIVESKTEMFNTPSVEYTSILPITLAGGTHEITIYEDENLKLPDLPTPPNEE